MQEPEIPREFDNPSWAKWISSRFAERPLLWSAVTCYGVFFLLSLPVAFGGESLFEKFAIPVSIWLGPMAGGIIRRQSCCMEFSYQVLPWCGAPLMAGSWAMQTKWSIGLRMILWVQGWMIWFGGAFVSFLHAFS